MKTYLTNNYRKLIVSAIVLLALLVTVLVANTDTRTSRLNNTAVNAAQNFLEANNINTEKGEYNLYLPILDAYNYLEDFNSDCIRYSYVRVANGEIEPNIICGTPTRAQVSAFNATVFANANVCDEAIEGECIESWQYAVQRYDYRDDDARVVGVGIDIIFPTAVESWSCKTIDGLECSDNEPWEKVIVGDYVTLIKNFTENGIDVLTAIPEGTISESFDPTINVVVNEIQGPIVKEGITLEVPQTVGFYVLKSELIENIPTNHVSNVSLEINSAFNAIIRINNIVVVNQPIDEDGKIIIPATLKESLGFDDLDIKFVSLEINDSEFTLTFKIDDTLTYAFVFERAVINITEPVINPAIIPTNYDDIVTATITTDMLINTTDSTGGIWNLVTPNCNVEEPIICVYEREFTSNFEGNILIKSFEYASLNKTVSISITNINEEAPEISEPVVTLTRHNEVTITFISNKLIDTFIDSNLGVTYPFNQSGDLENGYTYSKTFTILENAVNYSIDLTDKHGNVVNLNFETPSEKLTILPGYPTYSPTTNKVDEPVIVTIVTNKELNTINSNWVAVNPLMPCAYNEIEGINECEYQLVVRRNTINPQFQFVTSGNGSSLEIAIFDITINNIDESMPIINSTLSNIKDDNTVEVTITSNKRITLPANWVTEDNLTFKATYNVESGLARDVNIPVSDLLNLIAADYELTLTIPGLDDPIDERLVADISYSTNEPTRESVTAIIKTNLEIIRPGTDWTVTTAIQCEIKGENGESQTFNDCWIYTRSFSDNYGPQVLTLLERDAIQEPAKAYVTLNIQNIDKIEPEGSILVNRAPVNTCITVTILSTKPVLTPEGWTRMDGTDDTNGTRFDKLHCDSGDYSIRLEDKLGNYSIYEYELDNINRNPLVPTVSYSPNNGPTKDPVTISVGNEDNRAFHADTIAILTADDWDCTESVCTQEFADNYINTLNLKDIYGNTATLPIHIDWIDNEELEVSISYSPNNIYNGSLEDYQNSIVHNDDVTATITCSSNSCTSTNNKQLVLTQEQINDGWQYVDGTNNRQVAKIFTSTEVSNTFTIKDSIGNTQTLNINIIINDTPLNLNVEYSITTATKFDVIVTFIADRPLASIEGWTSSDDGLRLSKIISSNITNTPVTFSDIFGNVASSSYAVQNIDRTRPEVEVRYSKVTPTNTPVQATVKVTEQVTFTSIGWGPLNGTAVGACTINNVSSSNCYEYSQTFNSNINQPYSISDEAGNSNSFNITITNIDSSELTATVTYDVTEFTNGAVTATIRTNKPIPGGIAGWTPNGTNTVFTKTFTSNFNQAITLWDEHGNQATATISITNIDTVAPSLDITYSPSTPTQGNVVAVVTSNKELQSAPTGWTFTDGTRKVISSTEFTTNTTTSVTVTDLYGNTASIPVVINNIDRTAPNLTVSYSKTNQTNGNVTVTITANEPIKQLNGWTLVGDRTLTKTISNNTNETVRIYDLADNWKDANFSVGNIDKIAPIITVHGTNPVTHTKGTTYNDAGATATDAVDGALNVTTSNLVNANTSIGTHTITYTATDRAGNTATATRIVNVVAPTSAQTVRANAGCSATGDCLVKNGTNNYVWYSGHLWRAYWVNGDSVKLVTDAAISNFTYGATANWSSSNVSDWLSNTFYPTLNNRSNIIATANYCNRTMWVNPSAIASSAPCSSSDQVSAEVALLTVAEYGRLGGANSYLKTGDFFFTMTPSGEYGKSGTHIWTICGSGSDDCTSGEPRNATTANANTIGIRPVITLRTDVIFTSGTGTSNNPYRISGDNSASPNALLNTRVVGEHVSFAGQTWRIIRDNTTGTRLILDNFWNASPIEFGSNNFNTENGIGQFLNTTVYNSFSDNEKEAMQPMTMYINQYTLGNPRTTTLGTSGSSLSVNVGLPIMGDILSARNTNNTQLRSWTINPSSNNNYMWVLTIGGANDWRRTQPASIRPVIELRSTVKITSGSGTPQSPYLLSY